ncbi:MAG TPA: hypothetical protein VNX65_04030 [Patescibacteria group bacterium]|jgi:hypothetical protein|nr:hypothetical protein [Patescibacteria group bacterium]
MPDKNKNYFSLQEASEKLGVTVGEIEQLERLGILRSTNLPDGKTHVFTEKEIINIKPTHELTIAEEATRIGAQIQHETAAALKYVKKLVLVVGNCIVGYLLLVEVFVILFSAFPLQTARWIGLSPKPSSDNLTQLLHNQANSLDQFGSSEQQAQAVQPNLLQTLLKPASDIALNLVRYSAPSAYSQISNVTIINPNDVLKVDSTGEVTPAQTIKIPTSSSLDIASSGLIANLNSELLQGKKPGTNVGDIAIVGANAAPAQSTASAQSNVPQVSASVLLPAVETNIVPAINTASNTVTTGLSAANLSAGDFSSKINSGTYSISILGTAASFTGTLAGDVTGPQTSTTVTRINGNSVGLTTPTAGNLLIGSGTSWITRPISNDAVIDSSGLLTLKNVGTPGSYGSTKTTPIITTDANGRVTGVVSVPIANLTVASFAAPNISQWTNNSGYISNASTDTLTNKTISGSSNTLSNIPNSALANSSLSLSVNAGSGSVSLGGSLSVVGGGINIATISGNTITITGTEVDTLNAVVGRGASTATALTLSSSANTITIGTLTATGGTINGVAIGASAPSTGAFTTINGLTITNNGTNTLNIATGKTFVASNSITLTGADSTSFAFPTTSDDVVGRTVAQTLTNKTISASSNTVSGLTNTNLSGSAGITNVNLANSSVTINTAGPLTGGGAVVLGSSLSLACPTCLASGGTLFTIAATSGSNSSIAQGSTLTLAAGTNLLTTNNATGTVTFATSTTPSFTTINGLTITNNGTNTLNIAAGKALTISNSLTFTGTDSTSFAFPTTSDDIVGRTVTQTLTNKTITAASNTITGLTNTNLSGAAGITNANLANSSVTINSTSPLTGGGLVVLGASLSLACSTCVVTGGALFTAAATSGANSSISQGGTLTLAAGSNILTTNNAAGTITVATSATPSFTTVNGLTLTAAADGWTIAGGTTSRTLTLTAADITIGSTIKPTSAGALTIQSNGANTLALDAGGASSVTIGTTSANALTIGRSGVTTTVNGTAAVNNLTVGGGTLILKHLSSTASLTSGAIVNATCNTIGTVTVTGAAVGDTVIATPTPVAGGIETLNISWNAYVSSTNTVTIRGCDVAVLSGTPATQTWRVDVWQH